MVKKIFLVIIAAFILSLFTSSCARKAESKGNGKIAVVVSTLNNPWFVVLKDAARARAEELGYQVDVFDSQNDTNKESDHFDSIISARYAAILFNPTDAKGSIANVKRAKEAGIPTFCMDREIAENDIAASQILSNNYEGCVALGQYFVEKLNKKGTYVEILGILGDNNTWARSKGFHSVVDKYPDIKKVGEESGEFDRTVANEKMERLLQKYPDIDAVFCGNDAMATGAYEALKAAGKADKVMVFGFDGAQDVIDSIREGKIAATGMQFPKVMAQRAAEMAHEYISKGKRDFQQKVYVDVELVTKENVAKYVPYEKK
ncbi:MAG: D-ribose ABC transporter substrate-binding protein [Sedimentisphaerales bacterium]